MIDRMSITCCKRRTASKGLAAAVSSAPGIDPAEALSTDSTRGPSERQKKLTKRKYRSLMKKAKKAASDGDLPGALEIAAAATKGPVGLGLLAGKTALNRARVSVSESTTEASDRVQKAVGSASENVRKSEAGKRARRAEKKLKKRAAKSGGKVGGALAARQAKKKASGSKGTVVAVALLVAVAGTGAFVWKKFRDDSVKAEQASGASARGDEIGRLPEPSTHPIRPMPEET